MFDPLINSNRQHVYSAPFGWGEGHRRGVTAPAGAPRGQRNIASVRDARRAPGRRSADEAAVSAKGAAVQVHITRTHSARARARTCAHTYTNVTVRERDGSARAHKWVCGVRALPVRAEPGGLLCSLCCAVSCAQHRQSPRWPLASRSACLKSCAPLACGAHHVPFGAR